MKIPIKLENLENDIIECSKHLEYLKKISIVSKDLNEFIDGYKIGYNKAVDSNILNAHCVITIAQMEMSIILKSLHSSNQELEKKHLLKNGLLIIYESIKSIDKFNKKFKDYSYRNKEMEEEFLKYSNELKNFKNKINIDTELKEIRNNTAGHINIDFIEYSKLIESIQIEKNIDYLVRFRHIINGLNDFLFKCL